MTVHDSVGECDRLNQLSWFCTHYHIVIIVTYILVGEEGKGKRRETKHSEDQRLSPKKVDCSDVARNVLQGGTDAWRKVIQK